MPALFDKKIISQDSRGARRFRSFGLLRYSPAGSTGKKTIVNPRNISARGASFISEESLNANSLLEIDIYLPPLNDFITVIANVVRVLKIKDTDQYWVGVRFTAIDPADRNRINSYIEEMAKNPSMYRYLDKKAKYFKRRFL